MSAGFAAGVGYALRGGRLLTQPGLRRFVIGPVAINVVVFAFAIASFGQLFQHMIDRFCVGWPDWALGVAWLVFGTLAAVAVFFTFSLVANVLASPFNGLLADAVERHLTRPGEVLEFSWKKLLAETGRALTAALRKLFYFAWRAVPLLILSVIPGLNLLATPLWILFGGWMLAIEYLDCPLGNHGRLFPSAVETLRGERRMALGFGVSLSLLTMIPLLNVLAMPIGVAGATAMYCAHFAPRQ